MLLGKRSHKRLSIAGSLMDPREFSSGGRLETGTVLQGSVVVVVVVGTQYSSYSYSYSLRVRVCDLEQRCN